MTQSAILSLLLLFWLPAWATNAVTYETPGGRFGDQLIAYMHAKWVSYRYNIPLLYKPFCYSDHLLLDDIEHKYMNYGPKFHKSITLKGLASIEPYLHQEDLLFVVPYFPECVHDLKVQQWPYFAVDWQDRQFIALLRSHIAPKRPRPELKLSPDRIHIALHARLGGGFDDPIHFLHWPLKFCNKKYYVDQIRKIYEHLDKKPLYVYLFTDDPHPVRLAKMFQEQLADVDVVFGYREEGNSHERNVVEDFFDMMQYECLIRPDSNYSLVAEKPGHFKIVISPGDFTIQEGKSVITKVNVVWKV